MQMTAEVKERKERKESRKGGEKKERWFNLPMREESSLMQLWLMLTRVRLSTR